MVVEKNVFKVVHPCSDSNEPYKMAHNVHCKNHRSYCIRRIYAQLVSTMVRLVLHAHIKMLDII